MPEPIYAVGQWYENFEQTTDEEVIALLEHAQRDQARRTHALQDRRSE
jgi:predicted phosphoribosyltransferase